MNAQTNLSHPRTSIPLGNGRRNRHGISLLEVIVGTIIVGFLIVPLAGVIRASGQSIQRAEGSPSIESQMRLGLRWVGDSVRTGTITGIARRQLQIRLKDGRDVAVQVQAGNLVMIEGADVSVITENVRSIRFTPRLQTVAPNKLIGIEMTLNARDPNTRGPVTIEGTISTPPQV